jgi:type IV secretory pathway ATPase VirB11/archaellum biosynthesis ATPase
VYTVSADDVNGNQISFLFLAAGALPVEKTVVTSTPVTADVVHGVVTAAVVSLVASAQVTDGTGAPLAALSLRDALAVLVAALAGGRSGLGTPVVTATLPGASNLQVQATRVSPSATSAALIVPGGS